MRRAIPLALFGALVVALVGIQIVAVWTELPPPAETWPALVERPPARTLEDPDSYAVLDAVVEHSLRVAHVQGLAGIEPWTAWHDGWLDAYVDPGRRDDLADDLRRANREIRALDPRRLGPLMATLQRPAVGERWQALFDPHVAGRASDERPAIALSVSAPAFDPARASAVILVTELPRGGDDAITRLMTLRRTSDRAWQVIAFRFPQSAGHGAK